MRGHGNKGLYRDSMIHHLLRKSLSIDGTGEGASCLPTWAEQEVLGWFGVRRHSSGIRVDGRRIEGCVIESTGSSIL